ncbi:DUF4352 domain-containing protein [Lacticaseibacillus paracasei]|uniref:DUF4352 domain-containing protein n=1 Tax=Lacticaseibacillus paracasei TaxID=1597 RepID=UPI003D014CFB
MKKGKPFYKRVWFWILVVIVIAVLGNLATGKGSDNSSSEDSDSSSQTSKVADSKESKESSSSSSSSEKTEKAEKAYKVGDKVTVGDMEYTVNKLSVTKTVGPTDFPTTAKGTFLVVNLTVKNIGKKSVTVDSSFFKLLDNGKEFSADSSGSMTANQDDTGNISNSFFLQELNPGVELSGNIAFDVSEDQANSQTTVLQVQTGAFGTQKGKISLH